MEIREVIVVEGKNDTNKIQSVIKAKTIETHGTHLSKKTLELIAKTQQVHGIIIFTDPDAPGNQIRTKINESVPGCKNAFLPKKLALGKNKVGIEHAQAQDIIEALAHAVTYEDKEDTLSWQEFNELGLNGKLDSSKLRKLLMNEIHLGEANAKTCFKRLNMLQMSAQDIQELMRKYYE